MFNGKEIDGHQLATIYKGMQAYRGIVVQRLQDWFDLTHPQAVIVHKELQSRLDSDQSEELCGRDVYCINQFAKSRIIEQLETYLKRARGSALPRYEGDILSSENFANSMMDAKRT